MSDIGRGTGSDDVVAETLRILDAARTMGPGPEERRLRNRVAYKVRGRWPDSVVRERLHGDDDLRRRLRDGSLLRDAR